MSEMTARRWGRWYNPEHVSAGLGNPASFLGSAMTHLTLNKSLRDEIISLSLDLPLPASYFSPVSSGQGLSQPQYSPDAQGVRPLGAAVMEGVRLPLCLESRQERLWHMIKSLRRSLQQKGSVPSSRELGPRRRDCVSHPCTASFRRKDCN